MPLTYFCKNYELNVLLADRTSKKSDRSSPKLIVVSSKNEFLIADGRKIDRSQKKLDFQVRSDMF